VLDSACGVPDSDDTGLVADGGQDGARVVNNPAERRYEIWLGNGRAGYIDYREEPGSVVLVHTEVDPAFEGRGLGGRLVAGALEDIRARGLAMVPECPFVRAYLRRHPHE
jgi:uncharacterized protein